jgi:hypothetical protein
LKLAQQILIPLLLLAAAAAFPGCAATDQAPAHAAWLEEVEGMVRITRDGETMEAELDMELFSGDEVTTLENGQVTISLLDDHIVRLSENSRFRLEEIRTRAVTNALWARARLLAGRVFASLGELAGEEADFSIATATAVAAVKGTTFGVEVKDGETIVSVLEGEVDAAVVGEGTTLGERVRLRSGYESTIRARMRGRPEAMKIPKERQAQVRERLQAVRTQAKHFRKMRRSGELKDLRRLRALGRAGKLDQAAPRLQKYLRRRPGLKEQIIKHGDKHRQLRQERDKKQQRLERSREPGQKQESVRPARRPGPAPQKTPVRKAVPQKKAPAPQPKR